jgi:hypothetical protein
MQINTEDYSFALQGKIATRLKEIAQACWDQVGLKADALFALSRVNTTTQKGVNILWEDLPIKPNLTDTQDRRNLIINYDNFYDGLGTRSSIEVAKEIFEFDSFEYTELRDDTEVSTLYPFHFVRIRCNQDDLEKIDRLRSYLISVAPARCKFHTHITYPKMTGGLGTQLGRTLGNG